MAVLDKNVQLGLLDEVAKCSETNPLLLDSLTQDKQFNFKYLSDKGCFNPAYAKDPKNWHNSIIVGATGLNERGQEFRLKLIEELEVIELRRQSVKAFEEGNRKAEEANRIACCANRLAIAALVISGVSAVIALFWK